ncbi:MAG TPA: hypothetical protein VGX91_12980 [Candidatus Cybelea sp.]|jgi:hypothetical protein|nr:hypothetical protein [Candidatus Cybelea sp.]
MIRQLSLALTAAMLLTLAPSVTIAATPAWALATANSVLGGVNSKSTFMIIANVKLPMQCDVAQIVQAPITSMSSRHFLVVMRPPSGMCSQKTAMYNCWVESATFRLPITQPFEVDSKGKQWKVHLTAHAPTPGTPACNKP